MANTSSVEQLQASGLDHKTAKAISNAIARAIEDAARSSGDAFQFRSEGAGNLPASTGSIGWLGVCTLFASVSLMVVVVFWQSDTIRSDMRAEIGSVRGDMRAEFRNVREEISSVRTEMGSIQENIGGMQVKIEGLQEDIENVRTELAEVRSAISSLAEQMIRFEMLIQERKSSTP